MKHGKLRIGKVTRRSLFLVVGSLFIASSALLSCKKYSFDDSGKDTFLEVAEKNSSVLFYFASTSEPACGTTGYDQFETYLNMYDSTDALATISLGSIPGGNNDTIFESHANAFTVIDVPAFRPNFISSDVTNVFSAHRTEAVVANAACELSVGSSIIKINTTTEFFQNLEGEDYYLTPYIVVDSLVAAQAGHPDTPNTYHRKEVVDVARLSGFPVRYLGYKIASGTIDKGYKINLSFEAYRDPSWTNSDHISVILVLTKQTNGLIEFVNATTKYIK